MVREFRLTGDDAMRSFEMTAKITPEGTFIGQAPPDIPPGEHQVVVVIDEWPVVKADRVPLNFPVDHYGSWPEGLSLRREDLYDDSGR